MTQPLQLIDRYFELAPRPDADAYFSQFADDAIVEDEGKTYHGVDAIRDWRTKVPRVTYTVRDVQPAGPGHEAAVDIAGDFPGSPVVLRFHFEFTADGHVALLTIRP
jgi:hypothetical protein